jgi:CRP-like cAMP-binding protein
MDPHLTLSAFSFSLAPALQRSELINGLRVVKNQSTKTYLRVTTAQWHILEMFAAPCSVPAVLSRALDTRTCLPLGEFYELILKAVRANILLKKDTGVTPAPVYGWRLGVRPALVIRPLAVLLVTGVVLSFAFQHHLPASLSDTFAGLVIVSAALSFGSVLTACIVRGGGGEVFPIPWHWWRLPPYFAVDSSDAIMLPTVGQQAAAMATPAILATAAGILVWQRPEWSFIPLVALALSLRPIFGGKFAGIIRFNPSDLLSDAETGFIFPLNHRPSKRWQSFIRAIRHADTWARLAYGVVWTLAIICVGGRFTDTPPWTVAFWEANGVRVAVAIGASLAALALGYLTWEFYLFAREHVRNRRSVFRLWHRRWFGGNQLVLHAADRAKAVNDSAVFRGLPSPDRQQLALEMQVTRHRVWRALHEYGPVPSKLSLIVSGRIGLYRKTPSGSLQRVQVLAEGDLVGLHDRADPNHPEYFARTLTPVTLFTIERAAADRIIQQRIPVGTLTNTALKLPFLRRISLCQNWHFQAVERFATLSAILDVRAGNVIFHESQFTQNFSVIFESEAEVSQRGRHLATIHSGDFFGEIGLLQNSSATAQVSAKRDFRCLSINRLEFLRFVTHNYSVALELERVSSTRLGRAIFPLNKGNFRST